MPLMQTQDAVLACHALYHMGSVRAEDSEVTRMLDSRRFEQLMEIIELHVDALSTLDLCRLVWGLSILGSDRLECIPRVAATLEGRLLSLTPVEAATVMWVFACAREAMGIEHTKLMQTVGEHLGKDVSTLPLKTVVKVLWSAGVQTLYVETLVKPALALTAAGVASLSAPDAANALWASARLNLALDSSFFMNLALQVLGAPDALSDSELVNLCWALAYIDTALAKASPGDEGEVDASQGSLAASSPRELLQALLETVQTRLPALLPRDLAALFWAVSSSCAALPGPFLPQLRERLLSASEHMTVQQIAHVCTSIGTCARSLPAVLSDPQWYILAGKLSAIAERNLQAFSRSDLIDVAWGLTSLGLPLHDGGNDDGLVGVLRRRLQFTLHELEPRSLCRLMEACVRAPSRMRAFTEQLAGSVRERLVDMVLSDSMHAYIALARLGLADKQVTALTEDEVRAQDAHIRMHSCEPTLADAEAQQVPSTTLVALLWASSKARADALLTVLLSEVPHRVAALPVGQLCVCLCTLADVCMSQQGALADRARTLTERCVQELVKREGALPPEALAGTLRACRAVAVRDASLRRWAEERTAALSRGAALLRRFVNVSEVHNEQVSDAQLRSLTETLVASVETGVCGGVLESVAAPNAAQLASYWKGRCDEELRLLEDAAVGGVELKTSKERYELGKRLLSKLFLHLG
jgi:hypothetical protein